MPLTNQMTKKWAVLGQVAMRNLRLLLAVGIYQLISVAELAIVCRDREQDYRGTEIESETIQGMVPLDAALRAVDFCLVI